LHRQKYALPYTYGCRPMTLAVHST